MSLFHTARWCGFAVAITASIAAANEQHEKTAVEKSTTAMLVEPFLERFCIECHNADQRKGDRDFEELPSEISDDDSLVDFQDILDQLNVAEMPPPESVQPTDADRLRIVQALTDAIGGYHAEKANVGGRTVLRRLNSREYRNTVRDLLQIDTTIFDPTLRFPRDQTVEHLDNIGDALVTSSYLLANYLDAAEAVIKRAIYPLEKPTVKQWSFRDNFRQQPEVDNVHKQVNGFKHMTLYDVIGADKPEGAYGPILEFAQGVPADGIYEIRVRAEAVNRLHPYDESFVGTDRDEPFRLGIVPGDQTAGELHLHQAVEPLLAEIELADEPKWYTVRIPLQRGLTPRFTFRNGLMDVRGLWTKLIKKYPDQFPRNLSGIVEYRRAAISQGKLPQIHIHEIEIRGPIVDPWPTASQRMLLGDDFVRVAKGESLSEEQLRHYIGRFASHAYRRQASGLEIDQIMRVVKLQSERGTSSLEAFADGCKTILCSPNFLMLAEPTEQDQNTLTQDALASRLSYFLWSSTPDETLRQLANEGQLSDDEVLRSQVRRLLEDPRSEAFIRGFLDSWLALRDLGSAPPDRGDFVDFYRHELGEAMRTETELFFRTMLKENLDLNNFIDSNFTFVNRPLAKHYGIDAPAGADFHRVTLPDRRRGGLLGQASVLTVSANGIDTSPVVRGVWMLENFLGTPPSPPPPDVQPLDPDTRGATSIRDQLSKHRQTPTCYECHRKIDPLGFALENYDPIGRWRSSYGRNVPIDPSGELPDGKTFGDIVQLKEILMDRNVQVKRSIAQKMLAYATGRQVVPSDRFHIDRAANAATGARDLVEQIVLSEPFRNN